VLKLLVIHGAGMNMRGKTQIDVFGPMLLPEYKSTAGPEVYAEVVDRPLFSPTRRPAPPPPPPPPPEPPKQVMQTGQYELTGTIQVGDNLFAFLKETRGGKGVRAAEGDMLATGIKVAKVETGKVLLTQYDSEEEVRLNVSKSTRLTPAAQPLPGQAPQPPGLQPPQPQAGQPVLPGQRPGRAFPGMPESGQAVVPPFVPGVPTAAPVPPGAADAPNSLGSDGRNIPPRRRGSVTPQ